MRQLNTLLERKSHWEGFKARREPLVKVVWHIWDAALRWIALALTRIPVRSCMQGHPRLARCNCDYPHCVEPGYVTRPPKRPGLRSQSPRPSAIPPPSPPTLNHSRESFSLVTISCTACLRRPTGMHAHGSAPNDSSPDHPQASKLPTKSSTPSRRRPWTSPPPLARTVARSKMPGSISVGLVLLSRMWWWELL